MQKCICWKYQKLKNIVYTTPQELKTRKPFVFYARKGTQTPKILVSDLLDYCQMSRRQLDVCGSVLMFSPGIWTYVGCDDVAMIVLWLPGHRIGIIWRSINGSRRHCLIPDILARPRNNSTTYRAILSTVLVSVSPYVELVKFQMLTFLKLNFNGFFKKVYYTANKNVRICTFFI